MKKRITAVLLALALILTMPLGTLAAGTDKKPVIYGDANADTAVNTKDVLTMRKYIAEMTTSIQKVAADCNGDGAVNTKDVLVLRMFLAGLISSINGKEPELAKKRVRAVYHYDEDGNNLNINFYTYNSLGNITLMTDRQPDGELNWKRVYSYDSKNRLSSTVYTDSDEYSIKATYKYDDGGQVTSVTKTNASGTLLFKTTYTYSVSGKRTNEYYYNGNGKGEGKTAYTYDKKDRLIKEQSLNAAGVSYGYVNYFYNDDDYLSSLKRYGADGTLVGGETFSYDAQGNLKSHVYNDEEGVLDARIDYTYGSDLLGIPLDYEDEGSQWKYAYPQRNTVQKAICVKWDGKTVLWKDTYQYVAM